MDYLFFDIECANCFQNKGKICEFGYVLTDESFTVLQSKEWLINPEAPFDEYVLGNLLAYGKETYETSPKYTEIYPEISALFKRENLICFGFSVGNDFKFLRNEAARFSLPNITCTYYDARYLFATYKGVKQTESLEKVALSLGYSSPHCKHRAQDDAQMTMFVVKAMLQAEGLSLQAFTEKYKISASKVTNGRCNAFENVKQRKAMEANAIKGDNKDRFLRFIQTARPKGQVVKSPLNGKKLTITYNYEGKHFREMLSLVQLLKNHGCGYVLRASECDYMVTRPYAAADGSVKKCARLDYVQKAIERGKDIKIISFQTLLSMLGVKEKDLPSYPIRRRRRRRKKKSPPKE